MFKQQPEAARQPRCSASMVMHCGLPRGRQFKELPPVAPISGAGNEGEVFRFLNKPWSQDEIEAVIADYIAQTPLGRLEEPDDVADVVLFLASDSARFMTGQGINVTGGVYMT